MHVPYHCARELPLCTCLARVLVAHGTTMRLPLLLPDVQLQVAGDGTSMYHVGTYANHAVAVREKSQYLYIMYI